MSVISDLRKYRIFGFAILDLLSALLGTWLIFYILIKILPSGLSSLVIASLAFIPIGIVSHLLTKTPTTLNYKLGISQSPV